MYTAKIYQSDAGYLALTDFMSDYQVTDITGLGPSSAHINTSNYAILDGAILNSKKLNPRTIGITVFLQGDIEEARQRIYNYFRVKEAARFYFENGSRSVYIDGWVQSVEVDLFSMSEQMILTLYCPDPYFLSEEEQEVTLASGTVITNDSDTAAEPVITVTFSAACENLTIRNLTTGQAFGVSSSFNSGDVLTIVTGRKKKSVKLTSGSTESSLMGSVTEGSTFPELAPGENEVNYSVDSVVAASSAQVVVAYRTRYRGV